LLAELSGTIAAAILLRWWCRISQSAIPELPERPYPFTRRGQILLASELATEYGFTDVDGKIPPPPSRDPAPLAVFKPAAAIE